jgi:hypothetical protein
MGIVCQNTQLESAGTPRFLAVTKHVWLNPPLVGADWNHEEFYDCPETVGKGNVIIPTDELHDFSEG